MKGKINELKSRLNSYSWEWIILGSQLITFGTTIWINAIKDVSLHPIFSEASKPLWVFVPFIIGLITIYIGFSKNPNPTLVKLTIYTLSMYWAIMTYLLFFNDDFHSSVSTIASVTWALVPKVWLMAWRADFNKSGVKL